MRRPRSAKVRRRPQPQRIRERAAAVAHRREHPPTAVPLDQRRVAGDDAVDERALAAVQRSENPARGRGRSVPAAPLSGIIHISPSRSNTLG